MHYKRSDSPRRCGIERRVFTYTDHFPERRIGVTDRRSGYDRRFNKINFKEEDHAST